MIDVDNMGIGHPILDLANMFAAYVYVAREAPDYCMEILGMNAANALKFWDQFMQEYMDTDDAEILKEANRNLAIVSLIRKARGMVFSDYGDANAAYGIVEQFLLLADSVDLSFYQNIERRR